MNKEQQEYFDHMGSYEPKLNIDPNSCTAQMDIYAALMNGKPLNIQLETVERLNRKDRRKKR